MHRQPVRSEEDGQYETWDGTTVVNCLKILRHHRSRAMTTHMSTGGPQPDGLRSRAVTHRPVSHCCHHHRYSVTLGTLTQAWQPRSRFGLDLQCPPAPSHLGFTFLRRRLQD